MQPRSLIDQLKRTIEDHKMLTPGDGVLAAVSGGPDSVALLHLLLVLAPDLRFRLGVIHLNHGLRGDDSDADADFVRSLAKNHRLPLFEKKTDVHTFRTANRLSLEEAARQVRYDYFTEIAEANHYTKIALGHHADDTAELVLMNLIRGSGPMGLSGIPPVRGGRFIRPLIGLTRKRIKTYLDDHRIPYVTDASNQHLCHRRNRIRHELIPLLQKAYNPDISGTLSRLAAIMRAENEWTDRLTAAAFQDALIVESEGHLVLAANKLASMDPALSRRTLRIAVSRVKTDLRRIRFSHIDTIFDLTLETVGSGPTEKHVHLPDGIRIRVHPDRLIIQRMTSRVTDSSAPLDGHRSSGFDYLVHRPDTILEIPEIGGRMHFSVQTGESLVSKPLSRLTAYFDLDLLSFPLLVRSPRPGDRIRPLGLGGSQKVSRFFINRKIPKIERKRCPLLISDDRILWIAGYRTAEFGKITGTTQKGVKVQLFLA